MTERQSIKTYIHRLRVFYENWITEHASQIREIKLRLSQIRSNPVSFAGLLIIGLFLFIAIFAPYIAPYDPTATAIMHTYQPPSIEHPFG
ncbi:MAG: hypothetical protein ABEI86_09000, partial [Halobacteriaceae archaeon]